MTADADPAAVVDALARTARKVRTPCGDGAMVWRVWGAGEPLVLFHGGSGSWTHWIRNIPELSRHYELWVADIPGLGDSAMPPKPWVPATHRRRGGRGPQRAVSRIGRACAWPASRSAARSPGSRRREWATASGR